MTNGADAVQSERISLGTKFVLVGAFGTSPIYKFPIWKDAADGVPYFISPSLKGNKVPISTYDVFETFEDANNFRIEAVKASIKRHQDTLKKFKKAKESSAITFFDLKEGFCGKPST
jgi:hypothetical protein